MQDVTNASTITIGGLETGGFWPASTDVTDRYVRLWWPRESSIPSKSLPATELSGPQAVLPSWLKSTEELIRRSTVSGVEQSEDGRWLSLEVANAARNFFRDTADLLPGEPHVYSSRQGDLVAEFEAPRGRLTSIVSPEFVVLFSVVEGVPSSTVIDERGTVRAELEGVLKSLLAG